MIKKLLLSCLTALMVCQVSAKEITAQQALNRLMSGRSQAKALNVQTTSRMKLAYTSSLKSRNTYYVFNNSLAGGYVILSADDNMPAVLGYVDNGKFDYNNIPQNMKWYLKSLDATVHAYAQQGAIMKTISGNKIDSLLGKTQWDQSKPFNDLCPQYAGGANGKETALVGCVATAVSQVMYKWKYPKKGTGSRTYKFWWDTKKEKGDKEPTDSTEWSTDFSAHTYDWNNMLDYYDTEEPNWTTAQGNAVAVLLKDVGVAAKMGYGTDAAGGSGAQTYDAGYGMVTYFGYDKSMQYLKHMFFTDDEWQKLTYDDLAAGRPVIFGGSGKDGSGGHEYVCDGFDGNGMFHINWGWSGSQNGYFVLTGGGLVPSGSGSGGARVGASYGYGQDALFGIKPDEKGEEGEQHLATTGYTAKVSGKKVTLTGKFYNISYHDIEDSVGIAVVNSEGNCMFFSGDAVNLACDTPEDNISATIQGVPAGTYTIKPISKATGKTSWVAIYVLSTFKAATITIDEDGNINITNNDAPKIEAQGAVKTNKNSFRPTTKKDDGTLDAETLVLTCEEGIKNCDEQGHKLCFGCEFYDLTESDEETDVYWLTDYESVKTGAEEMAAGATIKEISVEILQELEAGHEYEVNPIFYEAFDDSEMDDDTYWDKLDEIAQYVDLGDNEVPVIKIEANSTAIKSVNTTFDSNTAIYNVDGRTVKATNIASLPKGTYIVKDSRGVRKIVKK